jgi:DNA helicase HerA-like ATPase
MTESNTDGPDPHPSASTASTIGLVDGSAPATTRRFQVVLVEDAVAQLDELVATTQILPNGQTLTHYGIVVEGTGVIEGAELPTDTARISRDHTMPGITSRRVEVEVLRTIPELWLSPAPGAVVVKAAGADRDAALFLDQMDQPLAVGLDQDDDPVYVDFAFFSGEKGGHVSISGISGVATKTTYALFLLYMLFETQQGMALLGPRAPQVRALVFSVKGEDLLHVDRANAKFAGRTHDAEQWRRLGVEAPGPFTNVQLYAPRLASSRDGAIMTDVTSRPSTDVTTFGWPPQEFIRQGLLRFCFAEDEDAATQVSFIEQRVRVQLARWAWPVVGEPGAVVLCQPDDHTSFVLSRVVQERRDPRTGGDGFVVRDFNDLIEFLTGRVSPDSPGFDPTWTAGVQAGTCAAFLRRLYAQGPRLGHLICCGVTPVELRKAITIVDLHGLHDAAQRFVVGALTSRIFEEKQGMGREPLRFVVLDELNKYAPRIGRSPIKEVLVDIAARGRSLGVLLIGAQQSAGDVDGNIIRNAAIKVVGRLDAGEAAEYRFLSAELRDRAARFLPGTMVLDQPLIPAPLPMRFPFPGFATCVAESAPDPATQAAAEADAMERL